MPEPGRVVIYIPVGDPGWELPAAQTIDWGWLGGGRQTMHELAVAIASTGAAVEMRGEVNQTVLGELVDAVGASPALPAAPRAPGSSDTVIVFEGVDDPLVSARLALSPARVVLLLLAPPGLCGWPFTDPGWELPDPLTVEIASVGRPEHFRAAAALGFELWTNSPVLRDAAVDAGVECHAIGRGRPRLPDPPAEKDVAVIALGNNRWAPLAVPVAETLTSREVATEVVEALGNSELLERLARAQILLHPMRVEGNSRVAAEARAVGTVPVVLASNPYALDLDETRGAVRVAAVDEMADAVTSLLASPERLERLATAGIESARAELAWEPFVARVSAALAEPIGDPAHGARAAMGAALQ